MFAPPARRSGSKLDAARLAQAQQLLDEGLSVPEISRRLEVLATTLHKAIRSGRLQERKKKARNPSPQLPPARRPNES
jgi:transposase-like protein